MSLLGACTQDARGPAPSEPQPLRYVERVIGARTPTVALPLIVVLHGLGGRPEHFLELLDGLPGPVWVVAPAAPKAYGEGYGWFLARALRGPSEELARELLTASDRVTELLDRLERVRPVVGHPRVVGFSQGGMLAWSLAVRHPARVLRAVTIGGWLPPELWPSPEAARRAAPTLVLHGERDALVPFGPTQEAVRALQSRGAKVELVTDPQGGHSVTPRLRAALLADLSRP